MHGVVIAADTCLVHVGAVVVVVSTLGSAVDENVSTYVFSIALTVDISSNFKKREDQKDYCQQKKIYLTSIRPF